MRQLYPAPVDAVIPHDLYARDDRPPFAERPWVLANMVSSVDGATAVDGVSGSLGGSADRVVFEAVRSIADVVLVAAGTVRAEGYGPVKLPADRQGERVGRGQASLPRLAIVTASLDLDLGSALFTESTERPVIFTVEHAPAEARRQAAEVADVVVLGDTSVDLGRGLAHLRRLGASVVLSEGGPSLIGALAAADCLDEVCWTVANVIVGGDSARLAHGSPVQPPAPLRLARIIEADETLFMRYVRDRTASER